MNLALATLLVLSLAASTSGKPIREGYATTYSYHDKTAPAVVYIATTRQGITLSDTHDPVAMKKWEAQFSRAPEPFYIRVFPDHIVAIEPKTKKAYTVALRDVVEIVWQK